MLEFKNLNVHYGKIHAIDGVSIRVNAGETVTIVGSNGAGKSTLLRTAVGLVKPSGGQILFGGSDIASMPTHKRVNSGIVLVPEGRHVFPKLTVRENIEIGGFHRSAAARQKAVEEGFALFPRLKERSGQLAGTLSGGEQQMLAIARALATEPKLLLLDEPSMGLAPNNVDIVGESILKIHDLGVTVLVVEQNIFMAFDVASRGYVLENGRIVLEGKTSELAGNDMVRQAYLGGIRMD